jgi:hypothetical protein
VHEMGLKSLQLYGTEIKGGMGGNRNAHKKTLYLLGQQIFFILLHRLGA